MRLLTALPFITMVSEDVALGREQELPLQTQNRQPLLVWLLDVSQYHLPLSLLVKVMENVEDFEDQGGLSR